MISPKDKRATINRKVESGICYFKEVFIGFEKVKAVRQIFGDETETVLSELKLDLSATRGYLYIDDEKGNIVINPKYLKSGNEIYLYLDAIHELVHIRQLREGKELFDKKYAYVDRPTEIEAYDITVKEARRLGMADEELIEYLRVEWVTEEDFRRFLVMLGISNGNTDN